MRIESRVIRQKHLENVNRTKQPRGPDFCASQGIKFTSFLPLTPDSRVPLVKGRDPMRQRRMSTALIEQCVTADGLWSQPFGRAAQFLGRAALFLDRDGVLVHEVNYLHRRQDVRLVDGAAEVIRRANDAGIPVIVTTNQAGIGRSYYAWDHFCEVQDQIIADLERSGAKLDAVFACPHHEDGRPPYHHPDHPARKPNPGMFFMARDTLGIALEKSWIVGDRAIDIRAGRNAGLLGGTHVRTGHGARANERETALALATTNFRVVAADSIGDLLRDASLFSGLLSANQR